MEFIDIFWPIFWAMVASGAVFEVFHLLLGMIIGWRANRRALKMRDQIAEKMGIDPAELDKMADMYGSGFPGMPPGLPPGGMPPTAPVADEGEEGRSHGQYL